MSTDVPEVLVGADGRALIEAADRSPGGRTAIWIGDRTDPELVEFETEIGAEPPVAPAPMTRPR